MSFLDPDSGVAMRHSRRSLAKEIFINYVAKKSFAPVSGSSTEYENAAKASFELADIFLTVQQDQPPVFDDKRPASTGEKSNV